MAIRFSIVGKNATTVSKVILQSTIEYLASDPLNLGIDSPFINLDLDFPLTTEIVSVGGKIANGEIHSILFTSNVTKSSTTLSMQGKQLGISVTFRGADQEITATNPEKVLEVQNKLVAIVNDLVRNIYVSNGLLDQSISMQHDIPYYFIPNITLNWKTVLAPHYYEEFWDREVLLRAPAYAVRELENGWIELQTYRDLHDPLSEESLAQVRKMACYLEKYHKQAWDSVWGAPQLYEGGDQRPGCKDCKYE